MARLPDSEFPDQLTALADGRNVNTEELVPIVYQYLRNLASSYFRDESDGQTLQPTALVHEAYLRLADQKADGWENRGQFLATAARMMRRVLIDAARARGRDKRGGDQARVTLMGLGAEGRETDTDLLDLGQALEKLDKIKPRFANIVELHFFAGLTLAEVAQAIGVSRWTIVQEWKLARAWLATELGLPIASE